jgi:hypothetical protein
LPRKKRRTRPRPRRAKREGQRKVQSRSARRGRTKRAEVRSQYRALAAILMFLYMLRLIDEKALNRIYDTLSPRKARSRRKRRIRKSRRK